jgi:hypothetical protein
MSSIKWRAFGVEQPDLSTCKPDALGAREMRILVSSPTDPSDPLDAITLHETILVWTETRMHGEVHIGFSGQHFVEGHGAYTHWAYLTPPARSVDPTERGLTQDEIDEMFESMPGGPLGFVANYSVSDVVEQVRGALGAKYTDIALGNVDVNGVLEGLSGGLFGFTKSWGVYDLVWMIEDKLGVRDGA